MIEATLQAEPNTRTQRGSAWIATCTVDGTTHTARSRSGALHELARILVANNVPDQSMRVTDQAGRTIAYGSIYEAAKWTYQESASQPLRRVRWEPYKGPTADDEEAEAKNVG